MADAPPLSNDSTVDPFSPDNEFVAFEEFARLNLPTEFSSKRHTNTPNPKKQRKNSDTATLSKRRRILFDDDGNAVHTEDVVCEQQDEATDCHEEEQNLEAYDVATPFDDPLAKYYAQRYRLFARFDSGIRLDAESWFSVTPEKIAQHIAARCACDVIADIFCGAGGNTIQFAMTCQRVIAIDIDPQKIACATHNARIYCVANRIDFVLADSLRLLSHLKPVDAIFLSPVWGGPTYLQCETYDLTRMGDVDGIQLIKSCLAVTPNVAVLLPRNTNISQLMQAFGPTFEFEQNFLNGKLKTVTVYFGNLIK